MIPKSLSATSIQVFNLCPSRWAAEMMNRSKGISNSAASTGTACHGALEMFVLACYVNKTDQPSLKLILDFYKLSYTQTFNSFDYTTEEYLDGLDMVTNWFNRTSFDGFDVMMCETKLNFELPTSAGPITFNYIFDRFDQLGPTEYRVVDYKTNRWAITSSDLKKKPQARVYALATAILLKQMNREWTRIWVMFDLLRHDTVGIVLDREDNKITWRYLKDTAEAIIATDEEEAEERLNAECRFCVKKLSCKALQKNVAVGGIHSLATIEERADMRAEIEYQMNGLASLLKELDESIMAEAKQLDMTQFETPNTKLDITVSTRRAIDAEMVEMALGPRLWQKYGESKITLGTVDKLLKGKELDDKTKRDLRGLIYTTVGDPKVKVSPKNALDDD